MNKTVNINLAGIFFHIDEDAYAKLQRYLEAIKRSLTSTQGKDEIINDIEARIAELFSEKLVTDRQVIGLKEVEEVIGVMGQPEDYVLDEALFEDDAPQTKTGKRLYRDPDQSIISGVSSGLGHYLGIGALWVRLLWILLTFFSGGGFILIYIALWIFIPEAKTTSEKLAMRGEPVTISNIERKIREGFDDVSGKMKDIDYQKYGYKARDGASSAASAVGKTVSFILSLFAKFIGILLLLFAGTTLIGLFIGLFTVGTFGIIEAPWTDFLEIVGPGSENIWIISLLSFFAIGIPFFFLFILGLRILVKKLRSLGRTSILVLVAVWILSVLGLVFFGIKQATEFAFDGKVVDSRSLPVSSGDTLYIEMIRNSNFNSDLSFHSGDFNLDFDENNQKVLWSDDVEIIVRSTSDSIARIEIMKFAEGSSPEEARQRAQQINYELELEGNTLYLAGQLTTDPANKFRSQEIEVVLYLPIGTVFKPAENTAAFYHYSDLAGNFILVTPEGTECQDCPLDEQSGWEYQETEENVWEESGEPEADTLVPAASNTPEEMDTLGL